MTSSRPLRDSRPQPKWRQALLGQETVAVLIVLLVPIATTMRKPMEDPDLFWHLKAGEWIVQHHAVPTSDPFSYMAAGHPWTAYSWLSELLFWLLYSVFGFASLLYLQALLLVAIGLFIYFACRSVAARPEVSLTVMLLALVATAGQWGPRPQVVAFALLAFLVLALSSPRLHHHLVWIAPLVVALWANVHVTFPIGIALCALAAVCARLERRPMRTFVLATILSAVATLVTPYGWRLIIHLGEIAEQPRLFPRIEEFAPIEFGSINGLAVGTFLFAGLIVLLLSRVRLTWWEGTTFLGSLAMALLMVKNVPIFALLAAPVIARHAEGVVPRLTSAAGDTASARAVGDRALVLAAIIAVAALAPHERSWRPYAARGGFPVAATDYVATHYPTARLLSQFEWAGFCIFRLFPGIRIAVDGRTQVYGADLLIPYMRTHFVADGWEEFLDRSRPDVILWNSEGVLARFLRLRPEWKVVYEDRQAIVFVPGRK